jgi:hypothetical protein
MRFSIKSLLPAVAAIAIAFGMTSQAHAYGEETHKYETKAMLIHAGIHPALAERLSTYAQHVDDMLLTSAMAPIPFVHARISRLIHFPTEGVSPFDVLLSKVIRMQHISSDGHGNIQSMFNVAQRDSMIANAIFDEALKTGNPYLIGTALHVLMDSFAHEGFNYIVGHGSRGHYPDRPWMFVQKHNEMRKLLFKAMTRIRDVLPENGLSNIKVNSYGKFNRQLNEEELYKSYTAIPEIISATTSNPHRDPLYTTEAISTVVHTLIKQGIAKPIMHDYMMNDLRPLFFERDPQNKEGNARDTWQIATLLVQHLMTMPEEQQVKLFDKQAFVQKYGALYGDDFTYIGENGEEVKVSKEELQGALKHDIVETIVFSLIHRIVPRPALGDADNERGAKFTFEDERLVAQENRIQRAKWQEVVLRVYKVPPTIMDKLPILPRFKMFAKKDIGENGEKLEASLEQIDKNLENNQLRVSIERKERVKMFYAIFKYAIVDYLAARFSRPLVKLGIVKKIKGNFRLLDTDVDDAKVWQTKPVFERLRQANVFKQIWTVKDADKIIAKWDAALAAFAPAMAAMESGQKMTPLQQINALRAERRAQICEGAFKGAL